MQAIPLELSAVAVRTSYFSHNTLLLPPWQSTNGVRDHALAGGAGGAGPAGAVAPGAGCRCAACRALAKAGAVRACMHLGVLVHAWVPACQA